MLPMVIAMGRYCSDVIAIRYVLPVMWILFFFYNGPYSGTNFATEDQLPAKILFGGPSTTLSNYR